MIFELIFSMLPVDGSKGTRATKLYPTEQQCVSGGTALGEKLKTIGGTSVTIEFYCEKRPDGYVDDARDLDDQKAKTQPTTVTRPVLWNGLSKGMTQAEAISRLVGLVDGVDAATVVKGTLVVKTSSAFSVAGQPSNLSLSFDADGLNRVKIISKPYCASISEAGTATSPWGRALTLLGEKYRRIDGHGPESDFTDGATRIKLSSSYTERCGVNALLGRYTITYMSESEARSQDETMQRTIEYQKKKLLGEL